MPRWLCVATGTASKTRSISSSVKPCSTSRSRDAPATSSCAQGHAVMPCASTPTSRRTPRSDATAVPISVYSSCVVSPDTGVCLYSG